MELIYSKVNPSQLLHIIHRDKDIDTGRKNVISANEPLQLSSMLLQKGTTFKPHKHIKYKKTVNIAQESWVVIKGKVKCIFYDIDNKIIAEPILEAGDCSITLYGGHNYEILEDNTKVLEYKTGPYLGQELDKKFI